MGSWKIIEILLPLKLVRNFLFDSRISWFSNFIDDLSEYLTVPSGRSCKSDKAVTDLPEPDSPTKDSVLPFSIWKEMVRMLILRKQKKY